MNKFTHLSYFIFSLLLLSCTTKTTQTSDKEIHVIDFKKEYMTNYDKVKLVDSTQLICLQEDADKDLMIKRISKISMKNDLIYIRDSRIRKDRLIVFDNKGNALNQIGSRGQGPGEYLNITDFYVAASNDVYIYDGRNDKVFLYDKNNKFIKDFKVNFEAEKFVALNNNKFLFSLAPYNEGEFKDKLIAITDKNFNIISTMFEFDENVDENWVFPYQLIEYDDKIIYNRPISNNIYTFTKDGIADKIIPFDFGTLNLQPNKLKDIEKLLESDDSYCYIAATPILINNTLLSVINNEDELFTCVYNIKSKTTHLNSISNYSVSTLNLPFTITEHGKVVSYFNADMYPNYEDDKQIPASMKKEIAEGATVVCLYNINNSFVD